jgi:hypothetical protein
MYRKAARFGPILVSAAILSETATAEEMLLDDFNSGIDDRWLLVDTNYEILPDRTLGDPKPWVVLTRVPRFCGFRHHSP